MVENAKSVLQRSFENETFLARFRANPVKTLDEYGYDLTEEQENALISKDDSKLNEVIDDLQPSAYGFIFPPPIDYP